MTRGLTPSQTIGPFYFGTLIKGYHHHLAPIGVAGERVDVILTLHDVAGAVVPDAAGVLEKIVEHPDATASQRAIRDTNAGHCPERDHKSRRWRQVFPRKRLYSLGCVPSSHR